MNEEYTIYYRNSFHNMWSRLSNAYLNIMEQEISAARANRSDSFISRADAIVARYNSDMERKQNLESMIEALRKDIESLENLLINYNSENAADIRLEIERMKSILRRRENELNRIEISISRLSESFDELENASTSAPKRRPGNIFRNLSRRISAAASLL